MSAVSELVQKRPVLYEFYYAYACHGTSKSNAKSTRRADYAESYLLITILAAVLGGVDPNGGFGKVLGLVLSLILLR